jgi:DNA-binding GntR family transcriptional regulator
MAETPRHLTKTDVALQVLRDRMRSGELSPGQRLRVEAIGRELDMSPTPIREALRVLQADGLVDYRAHHGIVVAETSHAQIREIFRLRKVLEPFAVELAVPRLDEVTRAELEGLHEQQALSVSQNRTAALARQNSVWHWTIYEASGSPILNDFVRRLWEAFPWRTMWALPGRAALSQREHEHVMEAIRAEDALRAAERMRVHVVSGEETLLARLEREKAGATSSGRAP